MIYPCIFSIVLVISLNIMESGLSVNVANLANHIYFGAVTLVYIFIVLAIITILS